MYKKLISIFLSLAIISSFYVPVFANESGSGDNLIKKQTIEKLNKISGGKLKLSENSGQIFLSGKLSGKQTPGEKSAAKFLQENKVLFGIDSTSDELKTAEVKKDEIGGTFVKFVQVINGIEVNGSLINVHFDKNGVIVSVNGKLGENKSITTIGNKTISESDAVEIAKKQYNYKSLRNTPKAEKLILTKDNKNYEVFRVNISYMEPAIGNYDVYVEAHSGTVIKTENNIRYDGPVSGSGIDVLGKIKNLNLYLSGTSYQMLDLTKSASDTIITLSMNHGVSNGYLVSSDTNYFDTEDHKASVSAHYNAGIVIDFYKNLFNRNSLDNTGMAIKSFTHYSNNFNNAFWDGYEMVYGDGDGNIFTYLSGDLDVVGHEMTHGIISNTADLDYHNQPGALNESMADVFGVLIETYDKYSVSSGGSWAFDKADWVIGDDIYTPSKAGDALRSLADPVLCNQPDNMNNYVCCPDTEDGDWGGVHLNSGIPNKAAYLTASNIGMEKTARIYYRALVNYMSEYANFGETKCCLAQAAADLYGENSQEVTAVNNAFDSVGVGQAGAEDSFEPNDTMQTSYPINLGTKYQSYISTNTDIDFYKLNISSIGKINITLSDLPEDYDLTLYKPNSDIAAQSFKLGTAQESIDYYAYETGDYYIQVHSCSGFSMAQKYSLVCIKKVTGINLDNTAANLIIGESINLTAAVNPIDASNKNITWSSGNSLVAAVDDAGKVTAAGKGTAVITAATADGGYTAICSVTVTQPVTGVSLDKAEVNLKIGESVNLVAAVNPADASNMNVTWSSGNSLVAAVDNAGKVTAAGKGTAVITAATVDGGYTAVCSVTVTKPVTGVSIDKAAANLKIGESINLIAAVNPIDASNKNVTWSSGNSLAAAVDNTGEVTAAGKGTAVITVTTEDGGWTAACIVTVLSNEKPVISGAADKTIQVGDSFDAKAGITATDKEDGNLTSKISISAGVNIYAVGEYPITYTVTDSDCNEISKSITVSVVARNIQIVSLIGSSRYDTAVKLSQSQFAASDTVIIVNGAAMADGLGATPLAAYMKAPLLLTETKSLPAATINEIKRLKSKKAIIVGGTGVVSDNVKSQLQALGLNVERLSGISRYGTSLAVAKYIDKNYYDVSKVVIANGYGEADALSIASAAGRDGMPIILAERDNVTAEVYSWLSSENIENAYIIGGTGVLSDNVLDKIDAITAANIRNNRLGGKNRFETNALVIDKFYGSVINKTYIAKGYVLIDALAAGPVAALNGAPVVLSGANLNMSQVAALGNRYGNMIIRTGGGISDTAVNSLKNCLQ